MNHYSPHYDADENRVTMGLDNEGSWVHVTYAEELHAEVERLRAELEARNEGLVEVAAAMRAVAERQREACVESMLKSVDGCGCLPCREQAVRTAPLVTEVKP